MTSRDELRTRPIAVGPRWHIAGEGSGPRTQAIYPVDPAGGGTWVAASGSGLVLCLLNANPLPPPPAPGGTIVSRGTVIPSLIDSAGAREAIERVATLQLDRFSPFRLLAVEAGERGSSFMALETSWDRSSVRNIEHPRGPLCVVSSGLGDPLVKPRLALFEEILRAEGAEGGDAPGAIQAQDRFHRHSWPDRPEISVLMRRPDARTVSITTVDVEKHAPADAVVLMSYEPVPDEPVPGPKSRRSERPATAGRRS